MMNTKDGHYMTASGPELRAMIENLTGYDPTSEPDFAWSIVLPCSDCGVHDSTALVSIYGETPARLCAHCLAEHA